MKVDRVVLVEKEGGRGELRCRGSGKPLPKVTWVLRTKDGRLVEGSERLVSVSWAVT